MLDKKEKSNELYIGMTVNKESTEKLYLFCEQNGIKINLNVNDVELDFHVSLLSSDTVLDDEITINKMSVNVEAVKWEILERKNENTQCLVLKVRANALNFLHNHIKDKYNLTHSFENFLPHITVDYNFKGKKPEVIPNFKIQLSKMYVKQSFSSFNNNLQAKKTRY